MYCELLPLSEKQTQLYLGVRWIADPEKLAYNTAAQSQQKICDMINDDSDSLKQKVHFFGCIMTVFVSKTFGDFVKLNRVIHCDSNGVITTSFLNAS